MLSKSVTPDLQTEQNKMLFLLFLLHFESLHGQRENRRLRKATKSVQAHSLMAHKLKLDRKFELDRKLSVHICSKFSQISF